MSMSMSMEKLKKNGLYISVSAFLALFSKQACRVTKKIKTESPRIVALASSKQLLSKANLFNDNKKKNNNKMKKERYEQKKFAEEEGFGDGGLWQRNILMGEKCQPPDFSGVIYYDEKGRQLPELPPRSPRVSPLPSYAFGMGKDGY